MKNIFDRRTKPDDFQPGDFILKWDDGYEDKGKHRKFDHLWKGPYEIVAEQDKNTYMLQEGNNNLMEGDPLNGQFLKHYLTQ